MTTSLGRAKPAFMRAFCLLGLAGQMLITGSAAAQKCPDGAYLGRPAAGQRTYLKNAYVWAVTPEFAKRFCMPEEFIATDLKGAEAIAYMHRPMGVEGCEIQDGREVCAPRGRSHWLEIYVKTKLIPKADADVRFYTAEVLSSGSLIRTGQDGRNADRRRRGEFFDAPGLRRPFYPTGPAGDVKQVRFHYLGRNAPDRVEEFAAAMVERLFYETWTDGLDMIALESWSWGAIAGSRYPTEPPMGYALGVSFGVHDAGKLRYPDEFLHVIELPKRITQALNDIDRGGGRAFDSAVRNLAPPRQSVQPAPAASTSR